MSFVSQVPTAANVATRSVSARSLSTTATRAQPLYFNSDLHAPSAKTSAGVDGTGADHPLASQYHTVSGDPSVVQHAYAANAGFSFAAPNRIYKPDVEEFDYMGGSASYGSNVLLK